MGQAVPAERVKLICGVLAAREEWLDASKCRLEGEFGPIDALSDTWPFDFTDYYEEEMGGPLLRRFYTVSELVAADALASIKLTTNRLEQELRRGLADAPLRPVNLDPGYVSRAKLVLATTKDYAHRVYLRDGIYAESTLRWRKGRFVPWDWTYPDYRTEPYAEFFARVRRSYEKTLCELHGAAMTDAAKEDGLN